jgi:hypothetical protein
VTLHYKTPEERKIHENTRGAQRAKKSRDKRAEEARQREVRYQRIEEESHALVLQNEQVKAEYTRVLKMMDDLRNDPPVRIVEKVVIEKVPTVCAVENITAVLKLCREARKEGQAHWFKELWADLGPIIQPFIA